MKASNLLPFEILPTAVGSKLQTIEPDTFFLTPSFQTFQIASIDSTVLGYSVEDMESNGGHFIEVGSSLTQDQAQTTMLRLACHILIDFIPTSGLNEVMERAIEIRDYYCSLANWRSPALPQASSIAVNPDVTSYERDSFTYTEE